MYSCTEMLSSTQKSILNKNKFPILNFSAEKLRLQEQLFRMRSTRKESHIRRQQLLSQAKSLQARASKYKEKVRVKLISIIYFRGVLNSQCSGIGYNL